MPRHPSSIIHTLCLSEYHAPSPFINHSYPMFIGISCPIILHQSFIPYVYLTIMPRHLSSIIHSLCLSEYHASSSYINHSYPMFIGISCPVTLHHSFIPCVCRNIMPHHPSSIIHTLSLSEYHTRHPSSIIHTLCLSEYHAPSSFINHSYPMFIGISCPIILHQSFISYVYLNNMPVTLRQSSIPYVYRSIMPHHPSSFIHTLCLSENHAPSSFSNHSYPMFIGISCPIILHQSFIPYVYRNTQWNHSHLISSCSKSFGNTGRNPKTWRHQMETFSALLVLCTGEFTCHQWIPLRNAIVAEIECFHWSAPEQTAEQTIEKPVIWDIIVLIMTSL